jgi:hypothetical protein
MLKCSWSYKCVYKDIEELLQRYACWVPTRLYMHICLYMCICIFLFTYMFRFGNTHVSLYISNIHLNFYFWYPAIGGLVHQQIITGTAIFGKHTYVYVYIYVCIYTYVYMYTCIYIYIFIYIYRCTHIILILVDRNITIVIVTLLIIIGNNCFFYFVIRFFSLQFLPRLRWSIGNLINILSAYLYVPVIILNIK